jgi:hypothetical protein
MLVNEQEEVEKWLKEHWHDRVFKTRSVLNGGDYSGAYTLYCSIVECDEQEYILKRYNPLGVSGLQAEKFNYQKFSKHQLLPKLEAFVPKGTDAPEFMAYGVLISFYPNKVSLDGISMVEALAIGLSMATILSYFADENRIYFDLRSDSLRVDLSGGLHLIDFSDLITMEELVKRSNAGLPVIDRQSKFIPPEGLRYQSAINSFFLDPRLFSVVRDMADVIHPERYQVFSLAGLIVELLVGPAADDSALTTRIAQASEPKDGTFTEEELTRLLELLVQMRHPNDLDRPSFAMVREVFWSLLSPRLTTESIASNLISKRAAKLLRTISPRDGDITSSQIESSLRAYWSTY